MHLKFGGVGKGTVVQLRIKSMRGGVLLGGEEKKFHGYDLSKKIRAPGRGGEKYARTNKLVC